MKKGFRKCKVCSTEQASELMNHHDAINIDGDVKKDVWLCDECDSDIRSQKRIDDLGDYQTMDDKDHDIEKAIDKIF